MNVSESSSLHINNHPNPEYTCGAETPRSSAGNNSWKTKNWAEISVVTLFIKNWSDYINITQNRLQNKRDNS